MEWTFNWTAFNAVLGIMYGLSLIPTIMWTPTVYKVSNPRNLPFWVVFLSVWICMPFFWIKLILGKLFK